MNSDDSNSFGEERYENLGRFNSLFVNEDHDSAMLEEIGVAHLPSSENDVDVEDAYDTEFFSKIYENPLKLLDTQLEPTPPCNTNRTRHRSIKMKRQSVKHKIDECSPTALRRPAKQMKPRAIIKPCTDYFTKISDEIMLQIFKLLPKYNLKQCALTCHRFRRLASDETLWKNLNLGGKNVTPEVVNRLIQRGIVTLRLSKADLAVTSAFANVNFTSPFKLITSSDCESKLENLDLSMASISPSGIHTVLKACSQLKNISLEHCELNTQVCEILSRNRSLEQLNMAMCSGLTSEGIKHLLSGCTKLKAVNFGWTNLDSDALDTVTTQLPKSLRRLNLSGCKNELTDHHVLRLTESCPRLEELDVSDATKLGEATMSSIVGRLPQLKVLSLSRCFNIKPDSYRLLGMLKLLTCLEVHGLFTELGVQYLKDKYPHIRINKLFFSTVARPTVPPHRTSLWGHKVND